MIDPHPSHPEQDATIGAYVRWPNQHARPKFGLAINFKIRHLEYLFKAA